MDDRRAQALRAERERKIRSEEGMPHQPTRQSQSPIPGAFAEDLELD
jgi:hypothetical protein